MSWDSVWHVGGVEPSTGAIPHRSPGCISRDLGQKRSSPGLRASFIWDGSGASNRRLICHAITLAIKSQYFKHEKLKYMLEGKSRFSEMLVSGRLKKKCFGSTQSKKKIQSTCQLFFLAAFPGRGNPTSNEESCNQSS